MPNTNRLRQDLADPTVWGLRTLDEQPVLQSLCARLKLNSGKTVLASDYPEHAEEQADGAVIRRHAGLDGAPDLIEKVTVAGDGGEVCVEVELSGTDGNQGVEEIDVICGVIGREPDAWLGGDLWMQRFGTWMPSDEICCRPVRADDPADVFWIARDDDIVTRTSESAVVLKDRACGQALLCGFTTLRKQRCCTFVETLPDGTDRLRAAVMLEGRRLDPGERVGSEKLVLRIGGSSEELADHWVDAVCRAQPPRVRTQVPHGWSDWQYYRETKTEDDILENLAALKQLKSGGYPVEYVVIDNGFCAHLSDWLVPSETFPHGIEWLFEKIREHDLKPGIWFAPYIVNVKAKVAQEHPEWMMLQADSDELERHHTNVGDGYVVDLSVPEAMDWMADVCRVMMKEWKAEWLKLDGPSLYHYQNTRLRNPKMTTVEMVTRSLEIIADISGDAVIEGEGYYGPSIGFVDVQRVNGDNHAHWTTLEGVGGNGRGKIVWTQLLLSGFLHRRFWLNHTENVILRDFPSPFFYRKKDYPNAIESIISGNEMQYQLTCHFLSGAPVLLTDPMEQLKRSPDRWRLISKLLPNDGQAARVVDEFNGRRWPNLYARRVETDWETWALLGVINHEDVHQDYEVDLRSLDLSGAHHAFEFWTETYLGVFDGRMPIKDVPAHGARLICLRPVLGRPQLLSTSLHLSQGQVELADVAYDKALDELRLTVTHPDQDDERIFIHVPAGFAVEEVDTNASGLCLDNRRGECVVVRYDGAPEGETNLWIRFRRD